MGGAATRASRSSCGAGTPATELGKGSVGALPPVSGSCPTDRAPPQTQVPCLQTLLPVQCPPQRPQLASSLLRLTQTPRQFVRFVVGQHLAIGFPAQALLHTAHTDPVAHWLPHCPQVATSVLTLVQARPQFFCADGQTQLVPEH